MPVEINLFQVQPEISQTVPAESKARPISQTLSEDHNFSRMMRDLTKKAKEKEHSAKDQEEWLLAGLLTAFPQLSQIPSAAVLNAGEGGVIEEESLAALNLNLPSVLETKRGAFQESEAREVIAGLSGEEDLMITTSLSVSTGDGTEGLTSIPEVTTELTTAALGNGDGTDVLTGFHGVTAEVATETSAFTTGEKVGSAPMDVTPKELNPEFAEFYDPVAEQPDGTEAEGKLPQAETTGPNVGLETGAIKLDPSVAGKEMNPSAGEPVGVNTQEHSSSAEMDLAQSGTDDGAADFATEMETLGLFPENESDSFSTVRKRADHNDVLFHQGEAAPVAPGEQVEQLESPAETMGPKMPKEEVVAQVVNGAKLMVKNGTAKIQIQLEPAELGKLELSLVIERDLVAARFVTETQGVQSLIEANLPQLRSALQEAGLRVDLLQVGVQTGNEPQMQDHPSASDQRFTQSSPVLNGTSELLAAEDLVLMEDSWHGRVNMRV